ncbi:MAG: cation transporter [Rhodocyclaceae bacterium]|nr:cation transporter [Rhodocyclaceae bacterium]
MVTEGKPQPTAEARERVIRRATQGGIAVNLSLVAAQVVVGLAANAFSLLADATHTLADLLADGLVLFANKRGGEPADRDHPYGHGRIETVASMVLGGLLMAVGTGFLVASVDRIQNLGELPQIHVAALLMAILTLFAKEGLFRFLRRVARRVRSSMVEANAWHARSDAASSLVVAVGIGGSLAGYPALEPLAAVLVGIMILRMGWRLAFQAVRELIDTGLDPEETGELRGALLETPGVMGVHELRTRRMGPRVLVDAHVQVDPRITVSEGHRVAETARARLLRIRSDVQDVLVHVDVEEDLVAPLGPRIPRRDQLVATVRDVLGPQAPEPDRVQLHYLGGQVEVEVFMPTQWSRCDDEERSALQRRVEEALARQSYLRSIRFFENAHNWCKES